MAHLHSVYDSDLHFVIDPTTKKITNQSQKVRLMQGDKKSERFTFELPRRYIEEHDMSLCNKVEVHYINISADGKNKSEDVYPVDDLQVSTNTAEAVTLSWLLSGNATKYEGSLNFLVKFRCLTGTTIDYEWNTDIFEGISVGKGMDNGEAVIAKYSDVLEAWKNDILSAFDAEFDIVQTTGNSQAKVMSQKAVTDEIIPMKDKISRNEKRITNIEQGIIPDPFETDDSVAYVKDVPANALPYAEIEKVGGMTYRDEETNTLKSAKVTEIVSVGKNLFDDSILGSEEFGFSKISTHEYFSDKIYKVSNKDIFVNSSGYSGTFVISGKLKFADVGNTSNGIVAQVWYTDGTKADLYVSNPIYGEYFDYSVKTNSQKTVASIRLTFGSSAVHSYVKDFQIEKGTVATEYEPYAKHALTIPEAVQVLDGYGWGVNGSVYNYINFENKQFVKRVACLDLGTLTWQGSAAPFRADPGKNPLLFSAKNLGGLNVVPAAISAPYKTSSWDTVNKKTEDKTLCIYGIEGAGVYAYDSAYDNPEAFKAALSGVMLYYELETPEIYEIPDLTTDNFIKVEGNGQITMVNEHGYAVPSEITYMLKGEAV